MSTVEKRFTMEFLTGRAAKRLEHVLALPARGDEQDWDVELADGDRLEEFIARFPEFEADDECAFAMAALIIASFDERLGVRLHPVEKEYPEQFQDAGFDVAGMYTSEERRQWTQVADILKSRLCLFDWLVHYWCVDEEPDGAFACTLFFRNTFRNQ